MFFGVWNKARDNKESIIYAIVTIFLLERVRAAWNRAGSRGRKEGVRDEEVARRQNHLVIKAALLYALPLLIPAVKYIYRSIEELSWSVQGLIVLKNTWAFFGILVLTECFLALVIYHLLRIYIDRMNAAIGFFTKIGRNIWDGSVTAVQMGGDVGSRVAGRVRRLTTGAFRRGRSAAAATTRGISRLPAGVAAIAGRRPRLSGRRSEGLESPRT